jgi:hypothetical protein
MEGTPEACHNSLRPVAGWLRRTDGLELPLPIEFGSATDHCSGLRHCDAFGPFGTEPAVREVASAADAECASLCQLHLYLTAGYRMPAIPWRLRGPQPNEHVADHAVEIPDRRIVLRFTRQHLGGRRDQGSNSEQIYNFIIGIVDYRSSAKKALSTRCAHAPTGHFLPSLSQPLHRPICARAQGPQMEPLHRRRHTWAEQCGLPRRVSWTALEDIPVLPPKCAPRRVHFCVCAAGRRTSAEGFANAGRVLSHHCEPCGRPVF